MLKKKLSLSVLMLGLLCSSGLKAQEAAAEAMDKVEQKLAVKGSAKAAAMTAEQVAEKAAKQGKVVINVTNKATDL